MPTNPDPDKYIFSDYDIRFDESEILSLSVGSGFGKNVIIFGVDISSSA